ncbi:MAG: GtrA family protein [Parcubacteria group bacterium GW2011_GWF2_40_10]|nr:MAG: GtrA family protein [Parcubacteria group bacterium GW2011_GWF2_40_10]
MKKILINHKEKIAYLLVGVWNTIFGYGSFVLLYYLFSLYVHYLFLLVISNILSITNAYVGYKFFVFKTKGDYLKEYIRFYLVYGVAFILNLVLLPVIVEFFKISPVIAQIFVIGLVIITSYFGHKHYSFGGKDV